MTIVTVVLVGVAALMVALGVFAVTNPETAWRLLSLPTPTLFVLNPSNTPDLRLTLPATWTPTRGPLLPTAMPSRTPTPIPSPTPSLTLAPTLTFTPPATVPPGWFEFEVAEARFAISMNGTWLPVPLLDRDAGTALAEITRGDSLRAAALRDGLGQALLDDLIMVAFDTATSGDPYVVNMSIAYASLAEGDTIDEIRDRHLQVYEESDFYGMLAADDTQIDSRPAHRIRYTTRFETGEEVITIYHLEVITRRRRHDGPILVFTFSTSEKRRNIYEGLFDRIVNTIRFTPRRIPTPSPTATQTPNLTLSPALTQSPGTSPSPNVTPTPGATQTPQ